MIIRTLRPDDAPQLLAFESANRAWFEQHIDARPPGFYSAQGVGEHVADYLDQHARGQLHPCVLLDAGGAIIGRANLKNIDTALGVAEVGYRIAHAHAGQGHASAALAHLKQLAQSEWRLSQLLALITIANVASARVLQKNGFALQQPVFDLIEVGGVMMDGYLYRCELGATGSA